MERQDLFYFLQLWEWALAFSPTLLNYLDWKNFFLYFSIQEEHHTKANSSWVFKAEYWSHQDDNESSTKSYRQKNYSGHFLRLWCSRKNSKPTKQICKCHEWGWSSQVVQLIISEQTFRWNGARSKYRSFRWLVSKEEQHSIFISPNPTFLSAPTPPHNFPFICCNFIFNISTASLWCSRNKFIPFSIEPLLLVKPLPTVDE